MNKVENNYLALQHSGVIGKVAVLKFNTILEQICIDVLNGKILSILMILES